MKQMIENHKGDLTLQTLLISSLILFIACLSVARLKSYQSQQKLIKQYGCQPPPKMPLLDPIFGLDLIYNSIQAVKNHTFLDHRKKSYEDYGNTYSSKLAGRPTISTIEPENVKAILSTNFKDYIIGSPRRNALSPVVGNSIFVVDGSRWEHSRALLRPSFTKSQVGDLATLEPHVQDLIRAIPKDGSTVDLADLFLRYTADVTTDLMFGRSLDSVSHPDVFGSDMLKAFEDAQAGGERRFRLGVFSPLVLQGNYWRAVKKIHAYIDDQIDIGLTHQKSREEQTKTQPSEEVSRQPEKYVLLHELSKVTDDKKVLRDELGGIFFAGRDTTSALLSNIFFVLSRNLEVFARLQSEVDELGGAKPSLDRLKGMKYLDALMNETLRIYPVVAGNSRICANPTIIPLGGGPQGRSPILVTPGTLIIFNMAATHILPSLWGEDAAEFRPDRWFDDKIKSNPWKFLPFSGGPRNCIGQSFARNEAGYTVVRLMQAFKGVESRDSRPWTEKAGFSFCNFNGVKVSLMAR